MKDQVPILQEFLADETRHLNIFWTEIQARKGVKCKTFWLCGLGGFFLGLFTCLFGKKGVMACTWAVEDVVIKHLNEQLVYLKGKSDFAAYNAVENILEDEKNHRDFGFDHTSQDSIHYKALRWMISTFTETVIWIGMR